MHNILKSKGSSVSHGATEASLQLLHLTSGRSAIFDGNYCSSWCNRVQERIEKCVLQLQENCRITVPYCQTTFFLVCFIIFDFSIQKERRTDWRKAGEVSCVCLTLSLLMVTVASATLRATGVQSSLLEEPIKLSIAPFSMSMPEERMLKTNKYKNQYVEVRLSTLCISLQFAWVLYLCIRLTYWSGHWQHPKVEHLKLLNQLCLWCGELCWGEARQTFNTVGAHESKYWTNVKQQKMHIYRGYPSVDVTCRLIFGYYTHSCCLSICHSFCSS